MTVAGTISTLRVTGVPGGYPAEQEATVKVRWVDQALEVMSDTETPLLKAIGGIDQFTADNTKIEWVLHDTWTDRGNLDRTNVRAKTSAQKEGGKQAGETEPRQHRSQLYSNFSGPHR